MSRPKSKSTLQLEQEIAELEAQYEPTVEDTPEEPEAPKVAEKVEKPVEPKVADPEPVSEGDEEPLSKEEATFKKRFGDLRRYSQKKEKELQDQIDALSRKLEASAETSAVAPTSEEDVAAWVEANPKAAALIQSLAAKSGRDSIKDFEADMESFRKEKQELDYDKKLAKIMKVHPDFEELQEDEDFNEWVSDMPMTVQNALYEGTDHEEVIKILNFYKSYEKKLEETVAKDAASRVTGKTKTDAPVPPAKAMFTLSQIDAMSLDEYEKNQAAIDEAHAKGLVIDDLH
jgi:hypothetical protein